MLQHLLCSLLALVLTLHAPCCPAQLPFARRQPTLASSIARLLGRPHINGQQRGSAGVDAAAAALLDNVRVAIYQLVATFEGLQGVLDKASRQPVASRPADVRAALAAFIAEKQ